MSQFEDDDDFDGIDEATFEDRHPKLSPNGEFVLELVKMKQIEGNQGGRTMVSEFKVIESNKDEDPAESMRTVTITGLDGPKKSRNTKQAKLKYLLAALLKKDPKQPPSAKTTWSGVSGAAGKRGFFDGKGVKVRCTTGPLTESEAGFNYIPTSFREYKE